MDGEQTLISLVDGECQQDTSKDSSVRALVGVTCVLSILGTLLIIFSYVLFKETRTPARLILVHLSFMDLGIALAHLVGVAFVDATDQHSQHVAGHTNHSAIHGLCVAQAVIVSYCAISSFLWTGSLAVYMYFRIVYFSSDRASRSILYLSYLICYGLPVATTLWLLLTNRLGYTWFSGGWCSMKLEDPQKNCKNDIFVMVFGYDLWMYITFILASVLYTSVHVHIHQEVIVIALLCIV